MIKHLISLPISDMLNKAAETDLTGRVNVVISSAPSETDILKTLKDKKGYAKQAMKNYKTPRPSIAPNNNLRLPRHIQSDITEKLTAEQYARRIDRINRRDKSHTADHWRQFSLQEIYQIYSTHPTKRWYALGMVQWIIRLRIANY
jgi:hypothetical protein